MSVALQNRRSVIKGGLGGLLALMPGVSIGRQTLHWNLVEPLAERRVVCFFLDGGLSQLDSFDPKPDADRQIRGDLDTISTSVPGLQYTAAWPRLAQLADRITTVRSIAHHQNEHDQAVRSIRAFQDQANGHTPELGSVIDWQASGEFPSYATINVPQPQTGALGAQFRGFDLLGPVGKRLTSAAAVDNDAWQRRVDLLAKMSTNQAQSTPAIDALLSQQQQVISVLQSPRFRRMLDLAHISQATRDRYGDSTEGRHALLARQCAVEGMGCTFVRMPGWDMHTNIFGRLPKRSAPVDAAIAAFLEDIDDAGLWDSTLTLVVTEFGRSPKLDGTGRGHWPQAMSFLAAGGPIPRGKVVGNTGPDGTASDTRHLPDDLLASVYSWLGLEWALMLPGEDARLNTQGTPIEALGFRPLI